MKFDKKTEKTRTLAVQSTPLLNGSKKENSEINKLISLLKKHIVLISFNLNMFTIYIGLSVFIFL